METLIFRHSFNYSQNESGITIPVWLKAGKDTVEVPEVKLDTGAACCIFKKEYAEALDLHIEEGVSR